jgi:hypothetical protein
MTGFMNEHAADNRDTRQNREERCTLVGDIRDRSPEVDKHGTAEKER